MNTKAQDIYSGIKPKVLFLILQAGSGGHLRSGLSLAGQLKRQGFQVSVALPKCKNSNSLLTKEDLTDEALYVDNGLNLFNQIRLIKRLSDIVRGKDIQIVHSFDLLSHIIARILKSFFGESIKVAGTVCGGTIKYRYPYVRPVLVFSRELKDRMTNDLGFKEDDVIVERARINTNCCVSFVDKEKYFSDFGISDDKKLILMVARISTTKLGSIKNAFEAIDRLAAKRDDFAFVLAGAIQSSDAKEIVFSNIEKINRKHGRNVAFYDGCNIGDTCKIIPAADIVLGVGRVCFEAMASKRPAIVLGNQGYAGIVMPGEDLEKIAYYNFSGRNVCSETATTPRIETFLAIVQELLQDPGLRERFGEFGGEYVKENLDVSIAGNSHSQLYRELLSSKGQEKDPLWNAFFGYAILYFGRIKDWITEYSGR